MTESGESLSTPQMFPSARLIVKDFDGTVANTFERSPNGIGVEEAYELSIEVLFGTKALEDYKKLGGLRNRSPVEVVTEAVPGLEADELQKLTSQFVNTKLNFLLDEIGSRFLDGDIWPRATPGYLEFCESLESTPEEQIVDDLILSSGHEPFIEKTYRAWGIRQPKHVLAEDTIRRLDLNTTAESLVKPSPILMDVARSMWRNGYGVDENDPRVLDEPARIIYVGDDQIKDGALAVSSGVEFILLNLHSSAEIWRNLATRLHLGGLALGGEGNAE